MWQTFPKTRQFGILCNPIKYYISLFKITLFLTLWVVSNIRVFGLFSSIFCIYLLENMRKRLFVSMCLLWAVSDRFSLFNPRKPAVLAFTQKSESIHLFNPSMTSTPLPWWSGNKFFLRSWIAGSVAGLFFAPSVGNGKSWNSV